MNENNFTQKIKTFSTRFLLLIIILVSLTSFLMYLATSDRHARVLEGAYPSTNSSGDISTQNTDAESFIPSNEQRLLFHFVSNFTNEIEQVDFNSLTNAEKSTALQSVLEANGESPTNIYIWLEIVREESKYIEDVLGADWVHHCDRPVQVTLWGYLQPPNTQIELKDYPNGVVDQATCEEYGAVTLHREKSYGLFQILPTSADDAGCENNWEESFSSQAECAVRVRKYRQRVFGEVTGFEGWSTFNKVRAYYGL